MERGVMNEFHTLVGLFGRAFGGETALSASTRDHGDRGRAGSCRRDRGATSIEYALMAGLIAVVIVASVTLFGQNMIQLFQVPSSAL
jgi:Flp pilus assembly pilin Flp